MLLMNSGFTLKVTALVTSRDSLLLIKHPFVGFELPAGTVEEGEEPLASAIREVKEETSVEIVKLAKELGVMDIDLPEGKASLLSTSTIFSRPDDTSFGWATIPRSAWVSILRKNDEWTQINYSEPDCLPSKNYDTYSLTGWIQSEKLAFKQKRHFYHFVSNDMNDKKWSVFSDCHTFEVGWHRLESLPALAPPQDEWLAFALERMDLVNLGKVARQ